MRYLIDTCSFLWFVSGDPDGRLGRGAKEAIADPSNDLVLSVASLWEISIKSSLGKVDLVADLDDGFASQVEEQGFEILPIAAEHALEVSHLPFVHRDPFDRLLISQCRCEGMTAITGDRHSGHPDYGIEVLW